MSVNTFFEFFFNSPKWGYGRGLRAGGKAAKPALSPGEKWLFLASALFLSIDHAEARSTVF